MTKFGATRRFLEHFLPAFVLLTILTVMTAAMAGAGEVKTLRFGVCLSQTGSFAEAGRKALAGVKARVNEFNRQSRSTGIRLEMVLRDDKSEAATAAAIVEDLAVREKVAVVIGPLSTNLMLGMREKAEQFKVVLISPSVTSPKIGKNSDWAFRVLFDDEFQGVALARFLTRRLGIRNVAAIINDRLSYAGSVFASFKETMEKEGGAIVAQEHYSWVADEEVSYDFTESIANVDKANPEIVMLPVNSTDTAAIIRRSTQMGTKLRFCGGDTWQHETVLLSSGNNLEDSFFISGIDFDSLSPEMIKYRRIYDGSNDPDMQLSSVLGYDAASLMIEGIKGGDDSQSIKDALYRVKDFDLATGTITIDPERGSEKTAFIHRINMVDGYFESKIIDSIKP